MHRRGRRRAKVQTVHPLAFRITLLPMTPMKISMFGRRSHHSHTPLRMLLFSLVASSSIFFHHITMSLGAVILFIILLCIPNNAICKIEMPQRRTPWRRFSRAKLSTPSNMKENKLPCFKFYTSDSTFCGFAARTWMTLVELNVPFDLVKVPVRAKPEWYLNISPKGKVPAIQNMDNDNVVYESGIINEYLVDLVQSEKGRASTNLLPTSPSERAKLRMLNNHVDTVIIPAQYAYLMNKDPSKDEELQKAFVGALSLLENRLADGGPYLLGNDFTLADVHALPFFLRAMVSLKHFKSYDVAKNFPKLVQWYNLCSQRESCRVAGKTEEQLIDFYTDYMKWRE